MGTFVKNILPSSRVKKENRSAHGEITRKIIVAPFRVTNDQFVAPICVKR